MASPLRSFSSSVVETATTAFTGAALSLCLLAAPAAHAQTTLYTDLGAGNSYDTMNVHQFYGPSSGTGSGDYAYRFVATSTGQVTSIDAAVQFVGGTSTSVIAALLTDSGSGTPVPHAIIFGVSKNITGSGINNFSSAAGPTLTAGTAYWVELLAQSNGSDVWFNDNTSVTGPTVVTYDQGNSYTAQYGTLGAFRINGPAGAAAPEPGSIALLALGGLPFARLAVRRRRRAA